MNRSPAMPTQKMTLRRFVRVTLDNFRQLIQTIATPTTSLPMPNLTTSPDARETDTSGGDTLGADNAGAHTTGIEAIAIEAIATDTVATDTVATDTVRGAFDETVFADSALASSALASAPGVIAEHAAENSGTDADADFVAASLESTAAMPAGEDIYATDSVAEAATSTAATSAVATAGAAEDAEVGDESSEESALPRIAGAFTLAAALESLLFVADEAAEPAQLARALGITTAEVEAQLLALDTAYREEGRGLRLQTRNGRYQLVTAPEAANLIETFLNLDTSARLSAPALETLAVVAYRQPVTRAQIEAVRGVDCSGVLRSLLQRGLLEEVGRLDAPGRPVLYGVTDLFMHHFGLTALHELPPLENTELQRIEEALEQQQA